MPNSKLPIQRASKTWLASASNAAADAHQKNFSGDELREPLVAALGEDGLDARDRGRAAASGGAGAAFSESTSATGSLRAGGGRFASDGEAIAFA